MWRIFVCFVDEEEKYLNKLFGVDVIEFLVFEWVLVFVLVRKKDGMFCWCVDYWVLNIVIKKDVFFLFLVDECWDILIENIWFLKLDVNWVCL